MWQGQALGRVVHAGEHVWYILAEHRWCIFGEHAWYIFGEHPWRILGEHQWYIYVRLLTAPTVREQIYALRTPVTVPEAAFEACRSFVPPQPVTAVTEPPEGLTGTVSERIKASVTVLEFVSPYVDLKPTASGAIGLCPFHDDHHPSFGVNAEGNYWHCFAGCGGGSVIDFWMKWRKCDFATAVRELAEMVL